VFAIKVRARQRTRSTVGVQWARSLRASPCRLVYAPNCRHRSTTRSRSTSRSDTGLSHGLIDSVANTRRLSSPCVAFGFQRTRTQSSHFADVLALGSRPTPTSQAANNHRKTAERETSYALLGRRDGWWDRAWSMSCSGRHGCFGVGVRDAMLTRDCRWRPGD